MGCNIDNIRPSEPHWLRNRLRFNRVKHVVRERARISAEDVRQFLTAYCACFLAVSVYIA